MGIPCKTAAGHAELASRERRLSQRHRTLLFLVDGRRSLDEVVQLGRQAGVPPVYVDELLALGLIVDTATAPDTRSPQPWGDPSFQATLPAPLFQPTQPQGRPGHTARRGPLDDELADDGGWSLRLDAELMPEMPARAVFASVEDSIGFGEPPSSTELASLERDDPVLAQARTVVMQALRSTAPVAGAVTMLRVRRTRSRAQLRALLPEVQARLSRPRHLADARLVIQRVEALLAA